MTHALRRIAAAFAEAGVSGRLHAVDIDSGTEIDAGADHPVVTASVHKLCLLVALHQHAAAGRLDLTEQVECPPDDRTAGPTGLAAMLDPVRMSLRDAAYLMTAVSDNAAADLLLARIGLDGVNEATARLGLTRTRAVHTFRSLFATVREDAGPAGAPALADPQVLARLRALDPARGNRSTPRDMTRLLAAVWRDEACTPNTAPRSAACSDSRCGPTAWPPDSPSTTSTWPARPAACRPCATRSGSSSTPTAAATPSPSSPAPPTPRPPFPRPTR